MQWQAAFHSRTSFIKGPCLNTRSALSSDASHTNDPEWIILLIMCSGDLPAQKKKYGAVGALRKHTAWDTVKTKFYSRNGGLNWENIPEWNLPESPGDSSP